MDLRCDNKKHGQLADGMLEVKCNSRFCGAGEGVVVLHLFDLKTAECVSTRRFKDPKGNIK